MKIFYSIIGWIIPWIILIGLLIISIAIPDSYWFSYKRFHIENTNQGEIPRIALDKTYNKEVYVYWTMIIYKSDEGKFKPMCRINGEDLRKPGEFTPTDLSWWFDGNTRCIKELPPGDYYAQEIIRWQGFSHTRQKIMDSNTFTIYG